MYYTIVSIIDSHYRDDTFLNKNPAEGCMRGLREWRSRLVGDSKGFRGVLSNIANLCTVTCY